MPAISLHGEWRLALDCADAGVAARWFAHTLAGGRGVRLPGSLAEQRLGDPVGADTPWTGTIFDRSYFSASEYAPFRSPTPVKLPFWLTPDNVFVGAAWYQREIEIPAEWVGRRVVLTLERPHWQTRAWLGERELGARDSLSTPHGFELGVFEAAGLHRLTLRVDNRLVVDVGENAHSVSDHTQGNWNGVVGAIELRATECAWIEEIAVYPNVAARAVRVCGRVRVAAHASPPEQIEIAAQLGWNALTSTRSERLEVKSLHPIAADGRFGAEVALGADAALWDEFSPVLHTLTVRLPNGEERSVRFGLREVRRDGRRLLLNGRPLFLRGTLDCALFPRTGFPPTDVAEWRRILGTIKSHGLNHVRFHSWCPPEAAFVAGDELGMYFQVEAATWPNAVAVLAFNSPRGIGDGDAVDAWALAEGERILRAYGNHPCFLLFAAGNEPGGPHHREYLARWVEAMRAIDSRRLYTGAAGWPELVENDFHVLPESRTHQWGDGLAGRLNATPPATMVDYRASVERRSAPLISHEIGQWCSYPALETTAKHTGHLRAANLEIFERWLREHGLTERYEAFAHAAGRLQVLCSKEEIEAQLRTPGLGGFQLLGLQDFAGQGTAPVGVLDHFWESKRYASAAEFRRFCGPTVLLARLPRRVFVTRETLQAAVEIAHFGPQPMVGARVQWRLEADAGSEIARGELPPRDVPLGNGTSLGEIRVSLGADATARKLRLVVGLAGTPIENDWELWVYPARVALASAVDVRLARTFDADAERVLRDGGRVVLWGGRGRARGDARGRFELGFTPIFWNTACTQRQAPHTLGIVCDPAHPALAEFPTEAHSNWQWWHALREADALILDALPRELRPIVEVIDDWYTARRLGLVFEVCVGRGRLLVCGVDLEAGGAANPVVRQLRASLLAYAASKQFVPEVEVSVDGVRGLFVSDAG
ncbi:MAG: glycoside hydrolase [Opitutae bacterium]|nr:glycoside hydrolase [Opitutae bacterium]